MKIYALEVPFEDDSAILRPEDVDDETDEEGNLILYWDDWEVTGNKIGDFIACYYHTIARINVLTALNSKFNGISINKKIRIIDNPILSKKRKTNALKWLPIENPEIGELIIVNEVKPISKSSIIYSTIDAEKFVEEIEGVSEYNNGRKTPRKAGKGLYFSKKDVGNHDFFKLHNSNYILCTENARHFIEQNHYSNVVLLEYGEMVD